MSNGDPKKITLFFLFLFFFILSPFLWAEERPFSINFWPIFQYLSDPIEGSIEFQGLGPVLYWKKDSQQLQFGIRPLTYWTEDEEDSLRRLEYFYPLGKFQIKGDEKKGYLFPLSLYREEVFYGERRWDFQFFPFFMGETEKGKDYFGLFPIYGFLYDRYGKDEIRFLLWPLYAKSSAEKVHTTNLIWPFLSFTEGERKGGFRFWPFYGYKEEFGVSRSEFFLWPFYVNQTKGMDTDDPVRDWILFPFYASKESKRFKSETFLWPFFSYAKDRGTGFEQWDFPWPFFQTLKGEDLYGIKIFPLYGFKEKKEDWKRIFILYPLYQLEEDRVGEKYERTHRILLVSRIRMGEGERDLKGENFFRIWPLFNYERDETGHQLFSLFYLIPFKDEGLERNLYPLFQIFRWERDLEGGEKADLFWGFYKYLKKEELSFWELAHLIGVKKEKGKKTLSVLKGLIQYKSDGEKADLRLFYLAFSILLFYKDGGSNREQLGPKEDEKYGQEEFRE